MTHRIPNLYTEDQMIFRCWLSGFVGVVFTVLAAFCWSFVL